MLTCYYTQVHIKIILQGSKTNCGLCTEVLLLSKDYTSESRGIIS